MPPRTSLTAVSHIDAEGLDDDLGGLTDALLEFLRGGLVFLDIDIPADEAGGEAGVLAALADGQRKLVLVDADVDDFLVADQALTLLILAGLRASRTNSLGSALQRMISTFSLLSSRTMFLTRDAAHADAGAHGIDLFIGAVDGDLGAVAGLAGDALDLDGAVGDLADLDLEEAADEIRMAAGEDDLRAARGVLDGDDVGAKAVADVVILRLHALAGGHDGLEFAEVHDDVRALEPADGAIDDLAGAVLELVVDHLLLDLADALHHGLLGGLGGDAAEIARGDLHVNELTDLGVGLELLGLGLGDLVEFVANPIDDLELGHGLDLAGLRVDLDTEVIGGADGLLGGGKQSVRDGLNEDLALDAFFPLKIVEG